MSYKINKVTNNCYVDDNGQFHIGVRKPGENWQPITLYTISVKTETMFNDILGKLEHPDILKVNHKILYATRIRPVEEHKLLLTNPQEYFAQKMCDEINNCTGDILPIIRTNISHIYGKPLPEEYFYTITEFDPVSYIDVYCKHSARIDIGLVILE